MKTIHLFLIAILIPGLILLYSILVPSVPSTEYQTASSTSDGVAETDLGDDVSHVVSPPIRVKRSFIEAAILGPTNSLGIQFSFNLYQTNL